MSGLELEVLLWLSSELEPDDDTAEFVDEAAVDVAVVVVVVLPLEFFDFRSSADNDELLFSFFWRPRESLVSEKTKKNIYNFYQN